MPQTFQGTFLKLTLILLSALISTFAYADLAEMHQQNCESEEAKQLMGGTGSCRIVIALKPLISAGRCTGTVFGTIPCIVTYISSNSAGASINLTCGEDISNPMINQDMDAKGRSYNVATIFTKPDQKETIINDGNDYKLVSSSALSLMLIGTSASIVMSLENGNVPFSNVNCN